MTVWPQGWETGRISDIAKAKLPTWPQPFLLPFSWKEASRGRGSNDVDVGNKNQEWQNKSTKANCITTKEPRSSTAFGGCRSSAYCLSTAAAAAAANSYYSTRLLQSGGRGR